MVAKKQPRMDVESVVIESLVLDDRNARRGDVDAIMASLKEFSQHRPVVVQRSTRKVLAGNHLCLAASALGWSAVDVAWVDDDDETAKRRALADNLVGDRSKWDDVQLKVLLEELDEDARASLPGIDEKALDKMFAEVVLDGGPVPFDLVARPGENYSYVVVVGTNDMDNAFLEETLGLRKMTSYKSPGKVGLSRVITVADLKKVLNAAVERGERYI